MKQTFVLVHDARRRAVQAVQNAPQGYAVVVKPATRTLDQNAAQWPYLLGFSQQLQWPVNGQMCWLDPEEWKDVLTCAFEDEVSPRLAMGWNGGVVMIGKRTSQFGKKKFAEWMEFLMAAAAIKGVTPVYVNERRELGADG